MSINTSIVGDSVVKSVNMGGSGFIEKEYPEFNNFFKCNFIFNNKMYTSAEQCYQAQKFKDEAYIEKIRNETDMALIYAYGNTKGIENLRVDNWDNIKSECMYLANYAKFSQNAYLKNILLSTEGKIYFYGNKYWRSENAKILTRIRDELRKK